MKKPNGFTLIELMIAVAVVGILVAVAYPTYTNSLIKGNRGNAKAFLLDVAQRQQQFLLDSRSYAASLNDLKISAPGEVTRFYSISITAAGGTPPTFTARATPLDGKRQVPDGWLEIDNTGNKTSQFPDKW